MTASTIPLKLDFLTALHVEKGLHLVTADRSGFVFLAEENAADACSGATDAAARAYVAELIRLARIGQKVENAAGQTILEGRGKALGLQ